MWSAAEGSNNRVTSGPQRLFHANDIGRAVAFLDEKMEGGSVIPDAMSLGRLPKRRIRDDPLDTLRLRSKPRFSGIEGGRRQIEYGKSAKTPC
jgi:hypothetical protein